MGIEDPFLHKRCACKLSNIRVYRQNGGAMEAIMYIKKVWVTILCAGELHYGEAMVSSQCPP